MYDSKLDAVKDRVISYKFGERRDNSAFSSSKERRDSPGPG